MDNALSAQVNGETSFPATATHSFWTVLRACVVNKAYTWEKATRMDNWYALQVLTGKEADIAAMLMCHGIQAIAPAVYRLERKDGQWTMVPRRAIPGYVFIRCQMTISLYYLLMGKPGVLKLLGADGGLFMAIPDGQMSQIMSLDELYGSGIGQVSHAAASADGGFEIMDGPLLALAARVTKIDMRRRRATIAIEIYDDTYEIDMAVEPTINDNDDSIPKARVDGETRFPIHCPPSF